MAIVTFSDGQTIDAARIQRVTLFTDGQERLWVEVHNGEPIRVSGAGVHADAEMLNNVRDENQLSFLVFEPPEKISLNKHLDS